MYAGYENLFVTIHLVLLIYHAVANKLNILLTNRDQNEFIYGAPFQSILKQL